MGMADRIRRLENALSKRGACLVDPLRWGLERYQGLVDALPPQERTAWEAWVRTGMETDPPEPCAFGVLMAATRIEGEFPGVLSALPLNWREPAALRQVLKAQPPRGLVPDPSATDPEADARAQVLIDRMVAELNAAAPITERSCDAIAPTAH